METQWNNKNAYRKFPFTDAADMVSIGGYTLPDDVFVDAQVNTTSAATRVYLHSLSVVGSDVTVVFKYSPGDSVATSDTWDGNTLALGNKVITSVGYFVFGGGVLSIPAGTHIFQSYVLDSLVIPAVRVVTAVTLQNITQTTTTVLTTTSALTLQEGSNVKFTSSTISVGAGLGTGLYDACANSTAIKTINGLSSFKGSFLFNTDGCYNAYASGANELFIENTCDAPCSEDDISAAAYYINRVNDGLRQIAELISTLRNNINTAVENYVDISVPERVTPYAKEMLSVLGSARNSTSEPDVKYYTFFTKRLYVYNPSCDGFTTTITVSSSNIDSFYSTQASGTTITIPAKAYREIKVAGKIRNSTALEGGPRTGTITISASSVLDGNSTSNITTPV